MKEDEWRNRGVEVNENATSKHVVVLHHFDEGLQFLHCFEDAAIAVEVDIQTWPANRGEPAQKKTETTSKENSFENQHSLLLCTAVLYSSIAPHYSLLVNAYSVMSKQSTHSTLPGPRLVVVIVFRHELVDHADESLDGRAPKIAV